MSMSPNDPDYARIMKAHRDSAPEKRKKAMRQAKNLHRNMRNRRRPIS